MPVTSPPPRPPFRTGSLCCHAHFHFRSAAAREGALAPTVPPAAREDLVKTLSSLPNDPHPQSYPPRPLEGVRAPARRDTDPVPSLNTVFRSLLDFRHSL